MAPSLDEVVKLAKSTHGLSQEQLNRILALAPTMGPADLEKMKAALEAIRAAEMEDAQAELKLRQQVNSLKMQWLSDKRRNELQQKESDAQEIDKAVAEASLNNL